MSFCPNCGKELNDYMEFCPGCGSKNEPYSQSATIPQTTLIQNMNAAQPYTTVQYTPGYEMAAEQPKKKANKAVPVIAIILVAVIGGTIGTLSYFNGDNYQYKKALKYINAGEYDLAFAIFDKLGSYEDSEYYLPFNGKYTDISVGDGRYLDFDDGEYTEMIPGSEADSYYYGKYEVDGIDGAVLTDEDGNKEEYAVYKNYIYQTDNDDFIFDDELDISSGYCNGSISECVELDFSSSTSTLIAKIDMKYIFEEDGTYTYNSKFSINDNEPSENTASGTYEIDGDSITLTPNEEDDDIETFLVIDEKVYRSVYVRKY